MTPVTGDHCVLASAPAAIRGRIAFPDVVQPSGQRGGSSGEKRAGSGAAAHAPPMEMGLVTHEDSIAMAVLCSSGTASGSAPATKKGRVDGDAPTAD